MDLACQVVPDIASFSVDDGFTYGIPNDMAVSVGSRVRVRVSGRRMRGWVTAVFPRPTGRNLLDIDGLVGDVPSFDDDGLAFLRWVAAHYVSPLSVILKRTVPPNVPRGGTRRTGEVGPALGSAISYDIMGPDYGSAVAHLVQPIVAEGRSVLVIAPSVWEVRHLAEDLTASCDGDASVVVAHSEMDGASQTSAWVASATGHRSIVVGTREAVLWPVADLGAVIVVEDARRVMKSPSTPTLGVREIAIERAKRQGVPLRFLGPLPTLEVVGAGADVRAPRGRLWPLVEVVDRADEPPTAGPVLERTRAAIQQAAQSGTAVFVLVPRRGDAAAFRCLACGGLRRCGRCDAASDTNDVCRRCGAGLGPCQSCGGDRWRSLGAGIGSVIDELQRSMRGAVGRAEDGRQVVVGTERDLIGRRGMGLAVAVDVDGVALAPHYRAQEDALRLLVRLGHTIERGRGRRCLVQTSDPTLRAIAAFRSGHHAEFFEEERTARKRAAFPPFGELIALEVTGEGPVSLVDLAAEGAQVLGPADVAGRRRWLIQGRDLTRARARLRPVIGALRDKGARVRVDVDPIDL